MPNRIRPLLKSLALYVSFSLLWIIASDDFLRSLPVDSNVRAFIGTVKGVLFVLITGGLFYLSLHRELVKRETLIENHVRNQGELLDQLRQKNAELADSYESTIQGWAKALEIREKETAGHCDRVTKLMDRMMELLRCTPDLCTNAHRGAVLHDIGKVGIPDNILLKPGSLNQEERAVIETHTLLAEQWLNSSPSSELHDALAIPAYHHERYDGSGYPYHLKGEEIPLLARIFAIIDVSDAMGSNRPYRSALPISTIYDHLRQEAGKLYDGYLVDIFIRNDIMRNTNGINNYYLD